MAIAESAMANPPITEPGAPKSNTVVTNSDNGTTSGETLHKRELITILDKFKQTTEMLSNWVTQPTEERSILVTEKHTADNSQVLLQNQKLELETQLQQIQAQFKAAAAKVEKLTLAAANQNRATQEKWHSYRERVTKTAHNVDHLRTSYLGIRQTVSGQIQEFSKGINQLKTEFDKIRESEASDRALAITKIEAFDHWIDGKSETKEQLTAKTLLERVTTKMGHTFRNLKQALNQVTIERDELQSRLEQEEETPFEPPKWNKF